MSVPASIEALPKDTAGRPILPYFAEHEDGSVNYDALLPGGVERVLAGKRCFICGQRRGKSAAFLVTPTGVIERVSLWPPAHPDCARYAAEVCPHFTKPWQALGETDAVRSAVIVWITTDFGPLSRQGRAIFALGEPIEADWYRCGSRLSRAQAKETILESALELLQLAKAIGRGAEEDTGNRFRRALRWLPAGESGAEPPDIPLQQ